MAGIFGSKKGAVTALVTTEGPNGISRTDNRLELKVQSLVNKAIDKKLRSLELENRLLHKIKNV